MYFYYLPSSISIQNQISVKFNMHQKLYYLNTGKMSKILLKCFQLLWSTFEFTSETMTCTFVSLGKMMSGHLTRILKLKFQRWHVPCPVSSQMLEERTGHARYTGPFRLAVFSAMLEQDRGTRCYPSQHHPSFNSSAITYNSIHLAAVLM